MNLSQFENIKNELNKLWIDQAEIHKIENQEHKLFDWLLNELEQINFSQLSKMKRLAPQELYYEAKYQPLKEKIELLLKIKLD